MLSPFEELLKELSNKIEVPLHADAKHCCAILIDEKLKVQLEADKAQQHLILSGYISHVTPGKFRENVLTDALKANKATYPQEIGIFGFSPHNNMLALFYILSMENLTGEKLSDILAYFVGKAMDWHNAISAGYSSPVPTESPPKPFELR